MPRAIFFDLDETLILHGTPVTELFQAACRRHLAEPTGPRWDRFHQDLRQRAGRLWSDIAQHQGRGEAAFAAMFRDSLLHVGDDPALAEPIVAAFVAAVVESTRPTDGAHALLDRLAESGIATGIITNGFSFLQKRKALAHGLAERVRFVLTSEDAGAHKPDARIFQRALATVDATAADCWHVGDHRDNDIAGALDAGLDAVWFTPAAPPADAVPQAAARDSRPCRVINRLDEIVALIDGVDRD
jgi:putative hydrolase of the HAD superfamily